MEKEKEIERLIGNRKFEKCPLHSGGEGMEGFARLTVLFKSCSDEALDRYVREIEALIPANERCFSCGIKLRIYLSIFCVGRIPDKAKTYEEEAREMQKNHRGERNYFDEVNAVVKKCADGDKF